MSVGARSVMISCVSKGGNEPTLRFLVDRVPIGFTLDVEDMSFFRKNKIARLHCCSHDNASFGRFDVWLCVCILIPGAPVGHGMCSVSLSGSGCTGCVAADAVDVVCV